MAERAARIIIVTKKAKKHPHHGGAWKVAYADFVTAMMALFMVLWLLSQTDQVTKQKLSEYFRTGMFQGAPSVMMGGSGLQENGFLDTDDGILVAETGQLQTGADAIKEAIVRVQKDSPGMEGLGEQVEVRVTGDGLLIQILDGGDELLFDLSSSELKPRLKQVLVVIAPVLEKLPNRIQLHGHTDARPFPAGVNRNNWDLSFERADAARRLLEENGVMSGKIAGIFAHGASSPYVKDDPLSGKNRRLAILAVRKGLEKSGDGSATGASSPPATSQRTMLAEPQKPTSG